MIITALPLKLDSLCVGSEGDRGRRHVFVFLLSNPREVCVSGGMRGGNRGGNGHRGSNRGNYSRPTSAHNQ